MLLRSEYWLRLNPWSPQALLVALIGVAMAVAIRAVLASFGIELDFAPFVPAILLASLIAGVPAGGIRGALHRGHRVVGLHPAGIRIRPARSL